jgi:hypothetical protein
VHFSNVLYGNAITVLVKDNEVEIPNELLTKAEAFFCWCYVSDNQGGYTIAQKRFNVKPRPKPIDYIYTPSEKVTIEQIVEDAIKEALENGLEIDVDLSKYVKKTDYDESLGFKFDEQGRGAIVAANHNEINSRSNGFKPIVPATLDYAVIQALTANKKSLTSKEQEAISVWLGVDERHVSKSVDGETGVETLYLGDVELSGTQVTDLLEMLENMGDIESALDELHNYAQNLVSGGAS